MDASDSLLWLTMPLQILLVDLLLGADNALMIGLACRALPEPDRKRVAALGVAGALLLRLAMTMVATWLLALPFVKLIGALVLMMIALSLAADGAPDLDAFESSALGASRRWAAATVIVIADAAMSIDNVVALAAIARGSLLWLAIGVGLSLPMLGYGGLLAAQWLRRAPGLVAFGAAVLGWIAGGMAVSDPLYADWAQTNAPGLTALAPLLGAAFVFLHSRFVPRRAAAPAGPRHPPRAPPVVARAPPPPVVARPAPPPALAPKQGRLREFLGADNSDPPPVALPGVEDRVVILGLLLLALVAGGFIAWVAYLGG